MLLIPVEEDVTMRELKDELASLRIDRDAPPRRRWRVPLLILLLLAVIVAGGFYYQRAHPVFGAIEVETFQPTIESSSTAAAGTRQGGCECARKAAPS